MFNKKLLKRIKSLEDYIGAKYVQIDNLNDYPEHITDSYGILKRIEKLEAQNK